MPGPLYVFSLGPIRTGEGASTAWIGWLDGQLVPAGAAAEPDAALRALRLAAPIGTALVCSPELARVGALHGFRSAELPEEVRKARAKVALLLAHVDFSPPAEVEIEPLIDAAAGFWAAAPWARLGTDRPLRIEVRGAAKADYEGLLMGGEGQEHGIVLFPKATGRARGARKARTDDALSVHLDAGPAYAADAIAAAYGLHRVPLFFQVRNQKVRAVTAAEATALLGALRAIPKLGLDADIVAETVEGPSGPATVTVLAARR